MPADSCNRLVYLWQGRYGGLGWLLNAYHPRQAPWEEMPWAIDNGAFIAHTSGEPWDADRFLRGVDRLAESHLAPRWIVVPDVVGDAAATLERWEEWAPRMRAYGWPLAFAAQDGHRSADVPPDADVVFLGGSTAWKRGAIRPFCAAHPRVHVGRVNTYRWLRVCADAGAESVDGTGWFRGDQDQLEGLRRFLAEQSGAETQAQPAQVELFA